MQCILDTETFMMWIGYLVAMVINVVIMVIVPFIHDILQGHKNSFLILKNHL